MYPLKRFFFRSVVTVLMLIMLTSCGQNVLKLFTQAELTPLASQALSIGVGVAILSGLGVLISWMDDGRIADDGTPISPLTGWAWVLVISALILSLTGFVFVVLPGIVPYLFVYWR